MRNFQPATTEPPQEAIPMYQTEQQQTSQNQQQQEKVTDSFSDGSHLDDIFLEDDSNEGGEGNEYSQQEGQQRPSYMSQEEFHKTFCLVCGVTSGMTGLNAINTPENDENARRATEALYNTAVELGWTWLLSPHGKWAERVFVIGAFAMAKAKAVKEELAARQAKDVTPENGAEKPKQQHKQSKDEFSWMDKEK
ncbi:MAG: hypothetical protein OXR68_00210 [Alphaproteobacteria bacterium]|nr:hypothetical protein [Alphaproteobacteria bacterium]MDD9919034.1 hypothetical protein [Alphaproteobacteria bacterium]